MLSSSHRPVVMEVIGDSCDVIYIQGAIVTSLQNRFKEFRRDRKAVKTETYENISTTPAKIKQPNESQKSPSIAWMQPPPVPMGEDKCSFDRFSSQLQDEAKRKKPRNEISSKLMEATYAHRRQDILESPAPIPELLKKYSFLGNEDEVYMPYICFLFYVTCQHCYSSLKLTYHT